MILNKNVIFQSTFSWEDVSCSLSNEQREVFLSLNDEQKQKLINKHTDSISKGLESGLMEDWTTVIKTAIDNSGLTDNINKIQTKNEDIETLESIMKQLAEIRANVDNLSDCNYEYILKDVNNCQEATFLANYIETIEDMRDEIKNAINVLVKKEEDFQ